MRPLADSQYQMHKLCAGPVNTQYFLEYWSLQKILLIKVVVQRPPSEAVYLLFSLPGSSANYRQVDGRQGVVWGDSSDAPQTAFWNYRCYLKLCFSPDSQCRGFRDGIYWCAHGQRNSPHGTGPSASGIPLPGGTERAPKPSQAAYWRTAVDSLAEGFA